MERIGALAARYGFTVIEDASHAIGSRCGTDWTGSCAHSAMTVFSFHPVKIITTGEGGLITTNDARLQARLALLRTHGITRDPSLMAGPSEGPWYYQQVDLGFNYRLTDLQAALGESQLRRLDAFVERRNFLADRYDRLFAGLPVGLPGRVRSRLSSFHLYPIRIRPEARVDRKTAFEKLRADGIGVNLHYIPVHTQPYYRKLGFRDGDFPVAERYYREGISMPLYSGLSEEDQDKVVQALRAALGA
jgi:dTDP-4-amino-4,6-dideoxygalactose transaminase